MDPARPNEADPADPFNLERADHPILETIEIAAQGDDCEESLLQLSEPILKMKGVCDVKIDPQHCRVVVRFDARKTHAPELHDAILKSGYKPAAAIAND